MPQSDKLAHPPSTAVSVQAAATPAPGHAPPRVQGCGAEHQLALLEQRIEGELAGWGVRVGIEVTPPEIERLFESGTSLHVDDGTRTTAERKKRFQMAQWVNPDRAEMFFARCVVFVEGETEPVLIPFLADKLGRLDPEVSVIDCGSKHNLPLYVAIAEAFRIPHVVIHDDDPLPDPIPDDCPDDRRKANQRTFDINATIADAVKAPVGRVCVLGPDLEKAAGVAKSQGDKKGKALAALDHFEGIDVPGLPQCMVDVVEHAYGSWGEE